MYKTLFISFVTLLFIFSCKEQNMPDAGTIINKSIEVAGGDLIKNSVIEFDFRDKHYKAIRDNGKFQYERVFKDSIGIIKDILNNKGFQRFVNETSFAVSDGKETAYTASVNSVHYFSILPFGLHSKAVNKTYLGKVSLKGNDYYKIKITFNQEGGGEDFEDVFIYWINMETYKVDYLAYSYNEKDGLGLRFREAYNERIVNGIRFVDYNNYKPASEKSKLVDLDRLFEIGKLDLLSKIELENVTVAF